ncbi:MAG: molybdopterin-dependent oxidoreductase [Chloroflexi bacterium]|nr:molybdopterin-dependent oxidoreductase [Chloroflexota bacterium]
MSVIGTRVPKQDAVLKVTGQENYLPNLRLPGLLHGKILRSRYAHAEIVRIDASPAERLPGVACVPTAADTPQLPMGYQKDQLPLKAGKVRSLRDEIAAVAAESEAIAKEALELIEVEYRELPPVFDIQTAMSAKAPLVHEANPGNEVDVHYLFEEGDVVKAFQDAAVTSDDTFELPYVTHAALGTMCCVAQWDARGRLTVWSTTQVPYLYQRELSEILGIHGDRIRVIQPTLGGGFGRGLDIYPIDPICCFLAQRAGRPVKIEFDRTEEFIACPTRQPARFHIRSAAAADGKLLARDVMVYLDNGAYVSWGPTTPYVMMSTTTGLYRVPNVRFETKILYTNNPYSGAMRGYGNLQATFAIESSMDILAHKLGMDPVEFRLRNANQPGDLTPQQMQITTCGLTECLRRAAEEAGWDRHARTPMSVPTELVPRPGQAPDGRANTRRGLGVASLFHVGGGARVYRSDGCGAIVRIDDFGKVTVTIGASEIGQGSDTVLAQICADTLGVPVEKVEIVQDDTLVCPWDVGVHASRTTFIAGHATMLATNKVKDQLLDLASGLLEEPRENLRLEDGQITSTREPSRRISYDRVVRATHFREGGTQLIAEAFYDPPTVMQDQDFRGNISVTYAFATQIAEIEVDLDTGRIEVLRVIAAHDVGRALNPAGAEGQIEGGVAMGLGYAVTEQYLVKDGKLLNPYFRDYKLATSQDMPEVKVILVETNDPAGPFGAKGLGETGAIAVAPAVANALYDATGVRIKELPLTPERVLEALDAARARGELTA